MYIAVAWQIQILLFWGNFLEFFSQIFLNPSWLNLWMQYLRYREPSVLVVEGLPHTRYCLSAFTYIVSFNQDNSHVHCELSVIALMFQARKQTHRSGSS